MPGNVELTSGFASTMRVMTDEIYRDDYIVLDDSGITLRRYYFPLASAKHIDYGDIRSVTIEPMTWKTGKGRLWGASDPRFWMPLDMKRLKKDTVLIIDVGSRIKACVTPDDPERVIELLRPRVPVS